MRMCLRHASFAFVYFFLQAIFREFIIDVKCCLWRIFSNEKRKNQTKKKKNALRNLTLIDCKPQTMTSFHIIWEKKEKERIK